MKSIRILAILIFITISNAFSKKGAKSSFQFGKISSIKSSSKAVEAEQKFNLPPWLPAFSTAALGGLLFGSDIGSSSSAVRIIGTGATDLGALDPFQLGQIASASLLGATIAAGSLIAIGDKKVGRKTELITAASLFSIGTLVQSLGPSYPIIILGRIIYGLGIGTG